MPTNPANTDAALDQRMRAEQLVLLFRQSRRKEFVSPTAGMAVAVGMWHLTWQAMLLRWSALLTVVAVLRQWMVRRDQRNENQMAS